jgi:prepilin-type N-terminal cleavage/methylation domain-containing protein
MKKLTNRLSFDKDQSRRGITLVEVIVSIALLGILGVLIANVMMSGLRIMASNLPRTKNALNVGGVVGAASIAPGGTSTVSGATVQASTGTATVTFDSGGNAVSSSVAGAYQTGQATASSGGSPSGAVSFWSFNPQ